MTVGEWLTHWLENIARPKLRTSTAEGYRSIKDHHLIPRIGGIKHAKFSPVNLQAIYADMERDGCSARTRQRVHAVLRRALNVAMRQEMIHRNPCQLVDVPKYDKPEMKTLSSEHAVQLMTTSDGDRFHAIIVLALTTGMRQGELFALKWEDIDLEPGRLSVRSTLIEISGKLSYGPPKSKAGIRPSGSQRSL